MSTDDRLSRHVHTFFHEYLTKQRNVSPHTLLSYRDSLKLFLVYASTRLGKPVAGLSIDELTVDVVLGFLDHLESERKNSVPTRNVRLAALHVFYRHVAARDPRSFEQCHQIIGIPVKRGRSAEVEYLEADELDAVLRRVDRSTRLGRRDYALLSFLYQTGVRVQEVIDVCACNLQLTPPAQVRIWGKGRKQRLLPLWTETAALLRALLEERNVDPRSNEPVFVNMRGQRLTRWGVRYILRKHVRAAVAAGAPPTLADKNVHPHTVRHSTAVHMLQAGAEPNAIRDLFGHASSETTWRYARITMEMKRKAMESNAPAPDASESPVPIWRRDQDLLAELERLGRRNDYVKPSGD